MTDQHRLDHAGFIPGAKMKTPNIDRIAASAAFSCCQSVNPYCTPARTALITGKYTHQIGTLAMSGDLSLQHPTFMQALQKAGYHTSGIGKFHFLQTWEWGTSKGKGIDLVAIREQIKQYGFDFIWETSGKQLAVQNYCDYCAHLDKLGLLDSFREFVLSAGPNTFDAHDKAEGDARPWPFLEEDYIDILTCDKIIRQIEQRPANRPFYIFGSFCSPHKPFDPPQRYLDQVPYDETDDFIPGETELDEADKKKLYGKRQAYRAMIRLLDNQVGRIFDALETHNLLDDTVILFVSDHGEMMGDHGRLQKGLYYKESVTVPAAIRHPEYLSGQVNGSPVEIVDFAATILEIAGIDPQKALGKRWPAFNDIVPARSLMPILRGETNRIRNFSFSECNGTWQMIQTERYKYIRNLSQANPKQKHTGHDSYDEILYDMEEDPCEMKNLIMDPAYRGIIKFCRRQMTGIMDSTPPAQTSWAPLK